MLLDAWATEEHYLAHIAPIWEALGAPGTFYVGGRLEGPGLVRQAPRGHAPILVAGFKDMALTRERPVILVEHGAGQTYGEGHPSYPGGRHRERVLGFVCPGEAVVERNRRAYPYAHVVAAGCPKLDPWHDRSYPRGPSPVVAVAFHWDCITAPEARSAWAAYRGGLSAVAGVFPGALGHAHPRMFPRVAPALAEAGLEPVADFAQVLDRADVLAVDNSSVGPEFASTGRPIVWLNAPWYRREVDHGGRFWDWCRYAPTVDSAAELPGGIRRALAGEGDPFGLAAQVYAHIDGHAAERAADAIRAWLGGTHGGAEGHEDRDRRQAHDHRDGGHRRRAQPRAAATGGAATGRAP